MRAGHFLTFVAAVSTLGACAGGGDCTEDLDCGGGEVCANTHECLASSGVRRVTIQWTLSGAPASATSCASVERLELTIRNASGDTATYTPVPCAPGQFVFDKLPLRFDAVYLAAFVSGSFADDAEAPIPESGVVSLDLSVGSPSTIGG